MARTLLSRVLAPALAIALLGGCVSDYAYRSDGGGYYYGRPSVEYRYYGGYGGYGYPYGYQPYGYYPYGYYHRRPYYPGYPYYPTRPPYHRPPPRPPYEPPHRPDNDNDRDKSPWRDLDRIEREHRARRDPRPPQAVPQRPAMPRADIPTPRARMVRPSTRSERPRAGRRPAEQDL